MAKYGLNRGADCIRFSTTTKENSAVKKYKRRRRSIVHIKKNSDTKPLEVSI